MSLFPHQFYIGSPLNIISDKSIACGRKIPVFKLELLTEIFDKPLPYVWLRKDHGDWDAEFDVTENIRIEVTINDDFDQGIWYLRFHPTDSTRKSLGIRRRDKTKKLDLPGNLQFKVLATVLAIVKEFIKANKPDVILFYPGRKYQQNMLDAFIKQVPSLASGYVGDKSSGERTAYIIARSNKYLKQWKEKFHNFFDNPIEEDREDMEAADWVITEQIGVPLVGVGLTSVPWSWAVREDNAWIAQAWDYDGCGMSVTITSFDGDDYIVRTTSDISDSTETFKTAMSVIQDFIFKKRPKTITIDQREMRGPDGYFDNRLIPGYEVDQNDKRIVLKLSVIPNLKS